jgi:hypothetical protein
MVFAPRVGPKINIWACLWVLLRPLVFFKCWLSNQHLTFLPYIPPRYGVFCLWSQDSMICISSPLTFVIVSWSWFFARDSFVCPFADDRKTMIFVSCQSDIYFQFLEKYQIKLPRCQNGFHSTSRRFTSILLQWLNIIYYIKHKAVNS